MRKYSDLTSLRDNYNEISSSMFDEHKPNIRKSCARQNQKSTNSLKMIWQPSSTSHKISRRFAPFLHRPMTSSSKTCSEDHWKNWNDIRNFRIFQCNPTGLLRYIQIKNPKTVRSGFPAARIKITSFLSNLINAFNQRLVVHETTKAVFLLKKFS